MTHSKYFYVFCFLFSIQFYCQVIPLPNAHAHNDYEHNRPLQEGLENGFTSVEADIYLIDNELYVSHDLPLKKDSLRTLSKLYLDPLMERVKKNKGKIYPDYKDFFYLMIDIKSEGNPTYEVLKKKLKPYESMISLVHNTIPERHKPVKIIVSGHVDKRPAKQILNESVKIAVIDGIPEELGHNIPTSIMPLVSMDYRKLLSWNGSGNIDKVEFDKFLELIKRVHREGKKIRFWAAPDVPEVWEMLLDNGVDIINTDKLQQLRQFLMARIRDN